MLATEGLRSRPFPERVTATLWPIEIEFLRTRYLCPHVRRNTLAKCRPAVERVLAL
jgi:hypothetical protein